MGRWTRIKEEFTTKNLRLRYEFPEDFVLHQWQSNVHVDPFYVFYRFLFMSTLLVITYAALRWNWHYPLSTKLKAAAFFTNWSYIFCVLDAVLGFCLIAKAYVGQDNNNGFPNFPNLCRTYWAVQSLATELAFGVTISYWTFIRWTEEVALGRWSAALHVWNSSLLLMDFFIVAVPVKVLHVYFSLIVGFVYSIFSYIYYYAGGTRMDGKHYIYKLLDWRDHPVRAFFICCSGLAIAIVIRFLMFGLFRLRVWIFYTFYDEEELNTDARRRFVL